MPRPIDGREGGSGAEMHALVVFRRNAELVSEVEQLKLERFDRQSDMLGLSAAA